MGPTLNKLQFSMAFTCQECSWASKECWNLHHGKHQRQNAILEDPLKFCLQKIFSRQTAVVILATAVVLVSLCVLIHALEFLVQEPGSQTLCKGTI